MGRRAGAATGTYTSSGAEDQPRFNALPLASEFGALAAAIAIVMALIARERDGLGQRLEVPLFDAMFLAFGASGSAGEWCCSRGRPADPWSGTYQCRDGAMVLLNLATPRFVRRFLEATGTLQAWTARAIWSQTDWCTTESSGPSNSRNSVPSCVHAPLRSGTCWPPRCSCRSRVFVPAPNGWRRSMHRTLASSCLLMTRSTAGCCSRARRSACTARSAQTRTPSSEPTRSHAAPRAATGRLTAALEGFRVVDTTQVLAGPTAARTLAEFGAEVIKINNPWEEGAGYRWQVHRYHTDVNRGKRTILIDLKRPEGLAILWRLVENADAFLQNLRLGVAERLGFGYEQVRAHKPDIVYLSVSAFGYGGAWQYRPGYEPNAQAITGMQARMGGGVDRPAGQPFAINDYCTGLLGAFGLGLGLLHRLRTGEGQRVETSLGHAATFLQLPYMQTYEAKVWDEPPGPQAPGWGPLQRLYRAADAWFFLGAQDLQIKRLASIPGLQAVQGLSVRNWKHSSKRASAPSQRATGCAGWSRLAWALTR